MILRQNIYRHTNSETESSQKENSQKALLWENSPKSYKYWYKSLTGTIDSYNKTTFASKELWCSGQSIGIESKFLNSQRFNPRLEHYIFFYQFTFFCVQHFSSDKIIIYNACFTFKPKMLFKLFSSFIHLSSSKCLTSSRCSFVICNLTIQVKNSQIAKQFDYI